MYRKNLALLTTSGLATMGLAGMLVVAPAAAQMSDHPSNQPLTVAAEIGFAPFNMQRGDGGVEGFSVDMAQGIADRLKRPSLKVMDVVWANIFAGMYAKRYEYIIGPATITEKRAEQMLFGEPYLDVGLGFLTRQDNKLSSMDELKGKTVAVTSGGVQDDWMFEFAKKYDINVKRFDATADAHEAVMARRADAYMTMITAGLWSSKKQPRFSFDLYGDVVDTVGKGKAFGLPFRPKDVEFRNQVERALECMKIDGSLAAIHEKWFGKPPLPTSSTAVVFSGYGAPGWKGFTPEPHALNCPLK